MKKARHTWFRKNRTLEECRHCELIRSYRTTTKFNYFKYNDKGELIETTDIKCIKK